MRYRKKFGYVVVLVLNSSKLSLNNKLIDTGYFMDKNGNFLGIEDPDILSTISGNEELINFVKKIPKIGYNAIA